MSNYREIKFWGNLEEAVNMLLEYKEKGIPVCLNFNDNILYSDTVTMDCAYKLVTGKTKAEKDEEHRKWKENYDRELQEHKNQIPQLTKEWIKKGHEILPEDKWGYWDKIVPTRLDDLYRGWELGCCLDIIKILNNGTFEEAKHELNEQGHSGMSYGLVCLMIKEFSEKGEEFVNYVR